MTKWFAYIVVLLIFAPCLSSAKIKSDHFIVLSVDLETPMLRGVTVIDTLLTKNAKKPDADDKKRVKEVAKVKKQPKPEKIEPADNTDASKAKQRPKRQRRPEGMERPPEIPRRNGN